jgi:hypothetical protein
MRDALKRYIQKSPFLSLEMILNEETVLSRLFSKFYRKARMFIYDIFALILFAFMCVVTLAADAEHQTDQLWRLAVYGGSFLVSAICLRGILWLTEISRKFSYRKKFYALRESLAVSIPGYVGRIKSKDERRKAFGDVSLEEIAISIDDIITKEQTSYTSSRKILAVSKLVDEVTKKEGTSLATFQKLKNSLTDQCDELITNESDGELYGILINKLNYAIKKATVEI